MGVSPVSASTPWRPQPPAINDPEAGEYEGEELGEERESAGMQVGDSPPEDDKAGKRGKPAEPNWLNRARDAFRFSTSYIDSNYRQAWDNSIKAFNNQHPADSKYNGELFKKRSNLFRPKTRAVIRKNEAAAAAAFFSNIDLLDITANNQAKKEEVISAEVTKQVLQYRLTTTIPWFQIVMGAIQDAQVQGACCAHVFWRFLERHDDDGMAESLEDRPVIDLFPIENLRIDPSAHWLDPINTSPYLIHLIPMYWCDVQDRMNYPNPKGQRWRKYSTAAVFARSDSSDDSTRQARINVSQDPSNQKRDVSDYDIVWVHRHIHRFNGEDWEFYTIASERLLTDPEPLKNTVWHGKRPYVMGNAVIETHKPFPSSVPTLVKPLQDEANDVKNQRLDNVKFVLNKRWIAKRGKNVDLASLVRNTPGGITLADDPEGDIKEISWPDVTSSAYLEEDRIDGDFADLVGNFNPMQVTATRSGRESTNTMQMLQGPANLLTEYMLKTFTETFVQPVLRQLVMLEQHYESDTVIIALAGEKAKVFEKYGVQQVTDAILDRELNVTVNVGMGATDPTAKLQKFVYAVAEFAKISVRPPPGLDLKEDGNRFQIDGSDPALQKAQQQIQALTMKLQKLMIDKANKHEANVVKLKTTHESNAVKLALQDKKHQSESRQMLTQHFMDLEKGGIEREGAVEDRDMGMENEQAMAAQQQEKKPDAA